ADCHVLGNYKPTPQASFLPPRVSSTLSALSIPTLILCSTLSSTAMVNPSPAGSPSPPALGTVIDNGALQLVEILGYGGYGVVYRAIDTYSSTPTSYAVKCLPHSQKRNATRQRQLHIREITLHQLASEHPNVVTLHRVIEDYQFTFIVMEYCSDGDLFTQILHQRRYLGNNALIKEVFLQLLDAVDFCHSLNIYHRDLKPENILCFDGGLRLAITDFGLATTERMSTEFRTGSVYHMSPECQDGHFSPTKSYSPLFNDVWSLGIILLNLITGRNPWKCASVEDCTFQAYLKDPRRFLPSVLPISDEVNALLARTLEVDWRRRITLREMRLALKSIDNFYSNDVIFEDSMARCPWEAGLAVDSDSDSEPEPEPQDYPEQAQDYVSAWSNESDSEMVFANNSVRAKSSWDGSSYDEKQSAESYSRSMSPSPDSSPLFTATKLFETLQDPSPCSEYSVLSSSPSIPSLPATPNGPESTWSQVAAAARPKLLTLNTEGCKAGYYDNSVTMLSASSSSMHTALESQFEDYGMYSASLLSGSMPTEKASLLLDSTEDIGMIVTPTSVQDHDMDSYPTIDTYESSARPDSPVLGLDLGLLDTESQTEYKWNRLCSWLNPSPQTEHNTPAFSFLTFTTTAVPSQSDNTAPWSPIAFPTSSTPPSPHFKSEVTPHYTYERTTQSSTLVPPPSPPPLPIRPPLSPGSRDRKPRTSSFLNPIRLAFPRRSSSP
ncbi:Negative regulator of sexual conjugation and meiosis, partial [Grifola frondosa]